MNSLRIQFIALSMISLMSAGQAFGSNLTTNMPSGDTVIIQPGANGQDIATVIIQPSLFSRTVDNDAGVQAAKGLLRKAKDVTQQAAVFVHKNAVSPTTLWGNLKKATIYTKDSVVDATVSATRAMNNNRVSTALGAIVAAGATYGGFKLNDYKNELNDQKLNRIGEIIGSEQITLLQVQEVNDLINGLWMLPSTKKQIRAYVTASLQQRQLPAVNNTLVEEVVQKVQDTTKSVVQTSKNVANLTTSSVQKVLDALSKELNLVKNEFDNQKRTAKLKLVVKAVEAMQLKDDLKRAITCAYKDIIYSNTVSALNTAKDKLAKIVKTIKA